MKFEKYIPSDILKRFIDSFLIIESEDGMESKVLPDTSIMMAFRFKGSVSDTREGIKNNLPVSVISGLRKSPRVFNYSGGTANFLVKFTEGGAASFFNWPPLHELFETSLPLDHFIYRGVLNEIEDRLAAAENNLQRVAIIEQFILSGIKETRYDQLIFEAVRKIRISNGGIRIRDLAKEFNISQDPFEKRFRKMIGTSPKQFSAIVRLKNLIDKYPEANNLTDAAHTAGYFDQAHFIKDFKSFTGQTPLDFFKTANHW